MVNLISWAYWKIIGKLLGDNYCELSPNRSSPNMSLKKQEVYFFQRYKKAATKLINQAL